MVMISAQLAAALFLPVELELARLSTLVLAESRPAELAVSVLAEASKSAIEVEQDDIAFIPSSSACLQAEKFDLQLASWASIAVWDVLILHPLMVVASAVKLELLHLAGVHHPLERRHRAQASRHLCHVGQGHVVGGTRRLDLDLAPVEESCQVGQVLRSTAVS